VGIHSMMVEIPKGKKVIVQISGTKWGFSAFQPIPGWKDFDYENKGDTITRKFENVKSGIIDLKIYLMGAEKIGVKVYENGSKTPTWQKFIIVE
ncbi:MAG: hypothetical protein IH595_06265, partial [Bacteroidales bacterium]|nr:hypothetical protein [Bacteroidales bacterium]